MRTSRHFLLIAILAVTLQACLPTATPAPATQLPPTQQPIPTETSMPPSPTAPLPTDTTAPTVTAASATAIPTAADPTPAIDQPEAIYIQQPGPGSQVTSPVRVAGAADPTFEQSLTVVILTADGAPLVTTSTQIGADVGQRGPFMIDVPFTVSQEQQGFIQVFATSARDGGVTHLSSTGVTLLSGGTASIQPSLERPEQIVILQPQTGETISGGMLRVEGYGLASFEQTLLVEILDESGAVIASTPVTVAAPDLGQPGPFSVDLPYSASAAGAGRVQVRDVSPAHGGNAHLSSVEVRLEP